MRSMAERAVEVRSALNRKNKQRETPNVCTRLSKHSSAKVSGILGNLYVSAAKKAGVGKAMLQAIPLYLPRPLEPLQLWAKSNYLPKTIFLFSLQTEIAKRLNAIIAQILPFLSQEHQQQVASAVERAKQVTMTELNAIIGVSPLHKYLIPLLESS